MARTTIPAQPATYAICYQKGDAAPTGAIGLIRLMQVIGWEHNAGSKHPPAPVGYHAGTIHLLNAEQHAVMVERTPGEYLPVAPSDANGLTAVYTMPAPGYQWLELDDAPNADGFEHLLVQADPMKGVCDNLPTLHKLAMLHINSEYVKPFDPTHNPAR